MAATRGSKMPIHQAVLARDAWRYRNVKAANDNSREAEKAVMSNMDLHEFAMAGRGSPIVYAPDRASAERAFERFKWMGELGEK